jgi:hypothetical protein
MLRCAVRETTGTALIPHRPPSRPLRPVLVDPSIIVGGRATSEAREVGVRWAGRAVYPIGPYSLSFLSIHLLGRCARMHLSLAPLLIWLG